MPISTHSDFRARQTPTGVRLSHPDGRKIEVGLKDNRVTLRGDGFDHEIRVEGDTVHVQSLNGRKTSSSFPKLAYLKDSKRVALGVAASLAGVPVNLLSGEKPQPVYANMGFRMGLGARRDGSLKGGRYRVHKMDQTTAGKYYVFTKEGAFPDDGSRGYVPRQGIIRGFQIPSTDYVTRTREPVGLGGAFYKLSGTSFGEACQSAVTEFWRLSGKPGDATEAASVGNYVFNLAHRYDAEYQVYHPSKYHESLGWALQYEQNAAETWDTLRLSASKGEGAPALLERLGHPYDDSAQAK